jgi:hypothetical protein
LQEGEAQRLANPDDSRRVAKLAEKTRRGFVICPVLPLGRATFPPLRDERKDRIDSQIAQMLAAYMQRTESNSGIQICENLRNLWIYPLCLNLRVRTYR